jgi:hypothetical protein
VDLHVAAAPARSRAFSRMTSTAARLWSIEHDARRSARERLQPDAAVAREGVEETAPGMRGARMSNSVWRTRAPVGRVASPGGDRSRRPLPVPR